MLDTLQLSDDSIDIISAAYEYQCCNLRARMSAYAYMIEQRLRYTWVGGAIEHPIAGDEYIFWRGIVDTLYKCISVLNHLERGMLGEWCLSCSYNVAYHANVLKTGAEILGLR